MKVTFIMLCVLMGLIGVFFISDPYIKQEDFFDKAYYIDRFYSMAISPYDRIAIKEALVKKMHNAQDIPEFDETLIRIRINNDSNSFYSRYVSGNVMLSETKETYRWIASRKESDNYVIVYLGKTAPVCEDLTESGVPALFSRCIPAQ